MGRETADGLINEPKTRSDARAGALLSPMWHLAGGATQTDSITRTKETTWG
jgi:hypothetical protein